MSYDYTHNNPDLQKIVEALPGCIHAPKRMTIADIEEAVRGRNALGFRFAMGVRVRKTKGSSWQGRVVGFYSTALTPFGICVESEREPGSVQIYPDAALERVND